MESIIGKIALGVVRHVVTGWGGALVVHGWATQDQANQLVGAVMVIVPIAFSIYDKMQAQSKLKAAQGQ